MGAEIYVTHADLGRPTKAGEYKTRSGMYVLIDEEVFDKWKAEGFSRALVATPFLGYANNSAGTRYAAIWSD